MRVVRTIFYGANTVALSEETERNGENKPAPKGREEHCYSTVADCYEKRSIIITTNLEFSKWNGIFYDEKLTSAIIDRLIHHSHLLVFGGQSYIASVFVDLMVAGVSLEDVVEVVLNIAVGLDNGLPHRRGQVCHA